MDSQLAWLDFSEHERRKALDVIDLFRERDTRDELGIGTVRDALWDVLFPGTSTIQTRARYFLFLPWMYRALERRKGLGTDVERIARREEHRLIDALVDAGETEGVVGIEARSGLKRLPSHIYWQGLAAWGIRTLAISQSEYHRFFSTFARRASGGQEAPEDEGDREGTGRKVWHDALPPAPEDFPTVATLALREIEAQYLRERLLARQPGKLLSYLIDQAPAPTKCDFPWEHPQSSSFPERNQIELDHARKFALVMHGATLIYNLLLAEAGNNEDRIERYREDMAGWAADLEGDRGNLVKWDRNAFWRLVKSENPRIPIPTQSFINAWLDLALTASPANGVADRVDARTMVANREKKMKGALSRLANARALELWGGESGAYRLSYRWFRVQTLVNDIVRGLGRA